MSEQLNLMARLAQLVRAYLRVPAGAPELSPDDNLLALGLRSFDIVSLLLEIEKTFGIEFDETSLTPEAFASLAKLHGMVANHLPKGATPAQS